MLHAHFRPVIRLAGFVVVACLLAAPMLSADDNVNVKPAPPLRIDWSVKDINQRDVKVPLAGRPTVLLFVLAGQPQSQQAMAQVKAVVTSQPAAQVVLVMSGERPEAAAAKLAADQAWTFPIVVDKDYAACDKMHIRVWPTTLVVSSEGEQLAHLAGLPPAYARLFGSYFAFASGTISKAQLEEQLAAHEVIADTPAQMAARHLEIAERLMAKGLLEQVGAELDKGLQLDANNAGLHMAKVRLLLIAGQADRALVWLEKLDPASVPSWRMALLRGQVLIGMGKWAQARVVLVGATRLNPQPGEAYYCLGLVCQHLEEWPSAAEAFRRAFEATPAGREVARVTVFPASTTQPGN